nr:VanZ family protein [Secundilactobacillus folii]
MPYLVFVIILFSGLGMLMRHRRGFGQMITIISFGIYLAVVGYLTLTPTSYAFGVVPTMTPFWVGHVPTNPIPFRGIEMDFYLNILMMIPMGVYLALLRPTRQHHVILSGIAIGITIEGTQFILDTFVNLSRWVDINDVITNAFGVVIGYFVIIVLRHSPLRRVIHFFSLKRLSTQKI